MAKFRALMLWTDSWVADTHHLTHAQRGLYMDLLILMWRTPSCTVPNDDKWLAQHLRLTTTEIQSELRPIIDEFCKREGGRGGRLYQKRLKKEHAHSENQKAIQSNRAKIRWDNKNPDANRNRIRNSNSSSNRIGVQIATQSSHLVDAEGSKAVASQFFQSDSQEDSQQDEQRVVIFASDIASDDQSVIIKHEMLCEWEKELPHVKNLRGQVRHMLRSVAHIRSPKIRLERLHQMLALSEQKSIERVEHRERKAAEPPKKRVAREVKWQEALPE